MRMLNRPWKLAVLVGLACVLAHPAAGVRDVTRDQVLSWLTEHRDAVPTFKPGDKLTAADLERVEPFLPLGYTPELDFPEFRMEIAATGDYPPHPVYRDATLQYAAQCKLAEDGSLEGYVAGQPFSEEELSNAPADKAGLMTAWNYYYRWQHFGQHVLRAETVFLTETDGAQQTDFSSLPEGMMSGGGGLERSVSVGWRRTYLSHLPQLHETDFRFPFRAAKGATFKELTEYYAPFEFRDQKLLVERWVDPNEDDTVNAYLPNERKVRRLSSKEKADTWLGSEITFDDFYGFDGHVLDNTWEYHGRRRILAIANSKRQFAHHTGPQSRVPIDRWEIRETHVFEGKPTLEGHPYGSRLLFIDTQNHQFLAGMYFDPEGRLMRGSVPVYSWSEDTLDHPEENRGAHVLMYKGYAVINYLTGNTTVTNVLESIYPKPKASKIRRIYAVDTLTEGR